MTAAPSLGGVLEAAVYVDDLDAAETFYAGILGMEVITRAEGRHVFFHAGEDTQSVVLAFIADATEIPPASDAKFPAPPHGARGPGHIAIAVKGGDLDGWKRYLKENGVTIEADFYWPTGKRSIYMRDPAGNSVELADRTLWRDVE